MIRLILAAALAAGAVGTAGAASTLTIARDGRATAVIVVADSANAFHRVAAQDLQHHLQRASGAEFAIVDATAAAKLDRGVVRLMVGAGAPSRALGVKTSDLEAEGYRVQSRENAIVFVGHDLAGASNATAWAVDCFLDRVLGVRWLWPGELGTHVPKRTTIEVPPIDLTGRPALEQRRLRARTEGATAEWLRHHQMGSRMKFSFGHAFTGWWRQYHETHPDYFAAPPAGQKQPYPQEDRVKLRIGNPAVADQIIANWRAAGRPDNWNVCPNDGAGWDTSPESRAMDLPDVFEPDAIWRNQANLTRRFVRFWNGLLVRMRRENPRVTISTYAYSCYRNPPADVKLEPGMVVGIVNTFAETESWRKWNDAGAKLVLRPNWWHMGGSGPLLSLHAQGDYFRYAHGHAMIGFDFDSLLGEWGNQGILYYVIARLSVRPELSVDEVIAEYAGAFGAAAPVIRGYFDYWEAFTRRVASPVPAGGDVSQDPNGLFERVCRERRITTSTLASSWLVMPYLYTEEVIAPARQILERARPAAAGDGDALRRIAYFDTALTLLREHAEVIRLASKSGRKPGETDADLVRQMQRFESLRQQATSEFGPIGFSPTLPSRLRITDPRKLEGL